MKKILIILFIYLILDAAQSQVFAQSIENLQALYVAAPNHRELVLKSFELAAAGGFDDTIGITLQQIKDRLETGVYSEDFEAIPGIIGEHFPNPWDLGPDFDFFGNYPFSKIPYGSYRDTLSGWYRGLNHGYDPVQGFKWPGAEAKTIEWANSTENSFIWDNAVSLYNSGNKTEAYQCLGHLLHLLADLSVPSHVKIVNHGMDVVELNQGTFLDPDKLELIIDGYELAISGGITVPGIVDIPNILNEFRTALDSADISNIPELPSWEDYFLELAQYTYNHPLVNQFYVAPSQNGQWGSALDENGSVKNPTTYATLPLVEINDDWFELKIKSTASSTGPILPEDKLIEMCNDLVPKAVEYSAALILHFNRTVTDVEIENILVENFYLSQNYPNPFNPSTKIKFSLPSSGYATLRIYNALGEEVAVLIDKELDTGSYEVGWNAAGLPSGVYFYQLKIYSANGGAEGFLETKKMMLLK